MKEQDNTFEIYEEEIDYGGILTMRLWYRIGDEIIDLPLTYTHSDAMRIIEEYQIANNYGITLPTYTKVEKLIPEGIPYLTDKYTIPYIEGMFNYCIKFFGMFGKLTRIENGRRFPLTLERYLNKDDELNLYSILKNQEEIPLIIYDISYRWVFNTWGDLGKSIGYILKFKHFNTKYMLHFDTRKWLFSPHNPYENYFK